MDTGRRRSPLEAMGGEEVYGVLVGPAVSVVWVVAAVSGLVVYVAVHLHPSHLRHIHAGVGGLIGLVFAAGALPMGLAVRRWHYAGLFAAGVLTPLLIAMAVWAAGPDGAPSITQCYVFFGSMSQLLFRRRDADSLLAIMFAGCGVAMATSHTPLYGLGIFIVVIFETSIVAMLTGWLVRTIWGLVDAETAALTATELASAELDRVSAGTRGLLERASQGLAAPLHAVIALSDRLATRADGPLNDDQGEYVDDIASSGRHLRSVLGDIGPTSTAERSGVIWSSERSDVSLTEIADECRAVLSVNAANHGITIDLSGDAPPVSAEARKVKQIVLNLMANAVRFSPDGGHVRVTVDPHDNGVELAVADEGQGVDPADHDRIFVAFEQAATTRPGGTGLGLSVSRAYAAEHGGRITVESRLGAGATFRLWLPIAFSAQPAASAPAPIAERGVGMWDTGGIFEQLIGGVALRRFLTRMVGTLTFAEGIVLSGGFLLPSPPGFMRAPMELLGVAALIGGAGLLWWPRPQLSPRGARVCSVIGVVATASVVWWSGGYASGAAATAFVVIGMLGFQGLSLRGALALAATIGAAYGAVLVTQHGNVAPFERWMVTMALVVAGGMMARWFVNLVPEKARNEHRARTAAEDANAELVRVTQQYRDTLAHVSHELRTPLNAIIGFAEVLRSNLFGELTDAQRAQVEDIVDAGRELLAFVNDILELSRIEAGRVAVEIGPASMSDVVSAAVVRDTPGPNIVADLDPEAEDIVADARRLAQALGAVVSVAASATPRGGQIRLTSHQGPNGFVVRVSDDGPAAARDGARGEVAMLLATRLTELQGGRVTVTASGSGGTTVSIEIPRRERSEASLGNVT